MPEGHTIHRLARDLDKAFRGEAVEASSPQGRFESGAELLDGRTCERFDAFGKHLLGQFEGGEVLHVHLGLIGKFRPAKGDPVGAVRLRLSTDDMNWDLRGPMVCRVGSPDLIDEVAGSIGPDPLRDAGGVDEFIAAARRRRIAIGAALLDQKLIAGIGNVYRSEILFLAGVDPRTPVDQLDESVLREVWSLAVGQLRLGVRLNRIVTVDPELVGCPTPRKIPPGERLYLYKRGGEPCRVCGTEIELIEVAGRKMWRCPTCQPR